MSPSLLELKNYLKLAHSIQDEIRIFLLEKVNGDLKINEKLDHTVVSEADLAAEELIRDRILEHYPEHGILGEEFPPVNPESDWQWIIDPIDGTQDFIMGIPAYGSILALHYKGTPVLGMIDVPETKDRYHAIKGGGAFWNKKEIHIKDLNSRSPLILSNYSCFKTEAEQKTFHNFFKKDRRVLIYPNCAGHGLVARGAAAAMVDLDISLWDIAATQIIIEEAGGQFYSEKVGEKFNIIFGNQRLVDEIKADFNRFTNLK